MNTPIRDFVERYVQSGTARLHMPGHKGAGPLGCEPWDITEISGADALYEASGIITESEANATALFGTRRTLYATEGSSQCIRAMLHLALLVWKECAEDGAACASSRPLVLAGRNAHRSFLTAAALNDCDVEWLWPETDIDSPCACPLSPTGLTAKLDSMPALPCCVYVTSPDYLGGMPDIRALAEVCHFRGVPLLVDNAHGADLHFLPQSLHPMDLGADLCCDSAHKTLPALTGAAYLHVNRLADARYARHAKQALALFGSTSPSYLLLQSLDCLNRTLATNFSRQLEDCCEQVQALKETLRERGFAVLPSDPTRLTLHTDGPRAAEMLRAESVEPEFVDKTHVVMMFSPSNPPEDYARVARALRAALPFVPPPPMNFPAPERAMTIREAMFSPCETAPVGQAIGRICASPTASCPPAVALVVPGERISVELAQVLHHAGIRHLCVVREPQGGT